MTVRRAFADIAEGQIHYRMAGSEREALPPLVMFHGSPGSSWALEALVEALGEARTAVAFDTLGQGDSCAPARQDADMAHFADAAGRALATMGPRFAQVDLFGTHTGARIATELAISGGGERVRKLILDGMSDGVNPFYVRYAETLDKSHLIDQEGTQFFKTCYLNAASISATKRCGSGGTGSVRCSQLGSGKDGFILGHFRTGDGT